MSTYTPANLAKGHVPATSATSSHAPSYPSSGAVRWALLSTRAEYRTGGSGMSGDSPEKTT